MEKNNEFKTLLQFVRESLQGKHVRIKRLRSDSGNLSEPIWAYHQLIVDDKNDKIIGIKEKDVDVWEGEISTIMFNDNQMIDIVFVENEKHKFPKGCHQDVYKFEMSEVLEFLT